MSKRLGALPPPDLEWQVGKTAASINFVNSAEKFLETCQDAKRTALLRVAIQNVKNGSLVFKDNDWVTAEEYLEILKA